MNGLAAHLAGWRRLDDVDARDVSIPINLWQIDRSSCPKAPYCTGCRHLSTGGCLLPTQEQDSETILRKYSRTMEMLSK